MTSLLATRTWSVLVPHHPVGARDARSRLSTELAPQVQPELLADAVSVIAELVGNAIRHADALPGGMIRVSWCLRYQADREIVEVRVTDGGALTEPTVRTLTPDAVDGRGLAIVAALARTWGVDRDGLGQSVWAELSCQTRPRLHRVAPDAAGPEGLS